MQEAFKSIFNPSQNTDALRPALFSDVAKISFLENTTGTGMIAIGSFDRDPSQPAGAWYPDAADWGGDIFVDDNFATPSGPGSKNFYALLHEIGHALGLEHGSNYAGSGSQPLNLPNLDISVDDLRYTVMSYYADPNATAAYPNGLQQYDIAALQKMYGANFATRNDDTVYTYTTSPGLSTIWDGGGTDTINTTAIAKPVTIDLRPGKFSSIDGKENIAVSIVEHLNLADQFRPLIENASSGVGNDSLIGNSANNVLRGGGGRNLFWGETGNDVLVSEGLNDILNGGAGNDALVNKQNDGNTRYLFSKGGGHDGIVDNPFAADNIDIVLEKLMPSDVRLIVERHNFADDTSTEPRYGYKVPYIQVIATGDTLVLPWLYRDAETLSTVNWSYAQDSIQFGGNGVIWDMNSLENYATIIDVSEARFQSVDPVIYAWNHAWPLVVYG